MIIGFSLFSRFCRRACAFTLVLLSIGVGLDAQIATFYTPAQGQSGESLKSTLLGLIDNHTSLSYTPGIWNAHKDLYEDPNNPDNLILFYSQKSFDKSAQDPGSGSAQYWNREHLWPRSYGVSSNSKANTDLFHLVPANKAVNNDRSNKYFDISDPNDPGYQNPAHPFLDNCSEDSDSWEPADVQKGWVARAMFYMDTRYIELELVDSPPAPKPSANGFRMAQLQILLDWNRQNLPTATETTFNQRVFDDYQHNRNPFIDFPEFADAIWLGHPSWGAWRLRHFTLEELADSTITADSADPDNDGLSNLMEMALYSDPRSPNFAPALRITHIDDAIVLTFQRANSTAELNLALYLQSTTDFANWLPESLSEASISPIDANTETVTLTIPNQGPNLPTFYRLLVERL